jgi:tRNA G10  N-methylase Trm11
MHYLFVFAQAHNDFRLPELQSVAELHGFNFSLASAPDDRDPTRPYMVIDLAEEGHARILAGRCILVKQVEYSTGDYVISFIIGRFMSSMARALAMKNYIGAFGPITLFGLASFPTLRSSFSLLPTATEFPKLVSVRS